MKKFTLLALTLALMSSLFMSSCKKEKADNIVNIAPTTEELKSYYTLTGKMLATVVPISGQANKGTPFDTAAYKVYAAQQIAIVKKYMTTNHLTLQQASEQWRKASLACTSCITLVVPSANRSSPCTAEAWGTFLDKSVTCFAFTAIPVIGEGMSIVCLVAAGVKLTAGLDKCKETDIKTVSNGTTPN